MSVRENITGRVIKEFRKCSFCGGTPEITKEVYDDTALGGTHTSYIATCNCGVKLVKQNINDLIKLWNGNKAIDKLLYVEEGSVDIDELKESLPDSTRIIIVRNGSFLPTEYRVK